MQNYVCVIGGINVDIKGIADSNSSLPDSHIGKVFISPGGVARNISENLTRLGVPVYLLGCIGDDEHGKLITEQSEKIHINIDRIIKSKSVSTAKYLSVSKNHGDLVYAVNDMKGSLEQITPEYIKKNSTLLSESRLIAADANLSGDVLNEIVTLANRNNIPLFIDTVSVKKAEVINELKGTIDFVSPNANEFEKLFGSNTDDIFKEQNVSKYKYVIQKKGAEGIALYDFIKKESYSINALPVNVIEPNGAGDSFNAGFIFALLRDYSINYSIDECIQFGMCAAHFTLQSVNSVSENLTEQNLLKLHKEKFNI